MLKDIARDVINEVRKKILWRCSSTLDVFWKLLYFDKINIITGNQDLLLEHGIGHFTSADGWLSLRVKENPSNEYDFDGPEFDFIQDTTAYIDEPFIKEEINFTPNVFNDTPFTPNNNIVEPKIRANKLDADGDGFISFAEFKSYWKSKGLSDKRIDELFASLDKDNNKVLDPNEY